MSRETILIGGSMLAAGALTVLFARRLPRSDLWPYWSAPIRGQVTSGWGDDRSYRGGTHEGLDIGASVGTPVYAVAPGVIETATTGSDGFAGKFIVIDHYDGFRSRYLHLNEFLVRPGQLVARGDMIGRSGTTGTSGTWPHLHFDVRAEGNALALYIDRYGHPWPDFPSRTGGYAVPAEAITPMSYAADMLARVGQRSVSFRCVDCPATAVGPAVV